MSRAPQSRCMVMSALLLALSMAGTPAWADGPDDAALARDLSKQGYELFLANKCGEAVALLERSQKLVPDPRTLVNLARCEDRLLRLGLALEHLARARDLAHERQLGEMASQIEAMIGQTEKRVAHVVVVIESSAPPTTAVRRGSVDVPPSVLTKGIPLDPGAQSLEVVADGYEPRTYPLTLAEGEVRTITVSTGPRRSAPRPRTSVDETKTRPGASRTLGIVLMAVGGAGVGAGAIFGLVAINGKAGAEDAGCDGAQCRDAAAAAKRDDARTAGVVSTIAFGAGIAMAAGGLALFLLSPRTAAGQSGRGLFVTPTLAGIVAGGSF